MTLWIRKLLLLTFIYGYIILESCYDVLILFFILFVSLWCSPTIASEQWHNSNHDITYTWRWGNVKLHPTDNWIGQSFDSMPVTVKLKVKIVCFTSNNRTQLSKEISQSHRCITGWNLESIFIFFVQHHYQVFQNHLLPHLSPPKLKLSRRFCWKFMKAMVLGHNFTGSYALLVQSVGGMK